MPPLLQLTNITRRFGGATALDGVSFDLAPGEVHALVGENGAGKSTLINLIAGIISPDTGEITLDGSPIQLANPRGARRLGIAVVHQEPDVFEPLTVAETMALAHGLPAGLLGWVRWREVVTAAENAVATMGEPISVQAPAGRLTVARRQMIQIAAAVTQHARIVLLDEPTSSLSRVESEWLFQQIDRLKASGAGIVYISHRFEEIARLADRITILRDGRVAWTGAANEIDHAGIVRQMVGRDAPASRQVPAGPIGAPRLSVRGLTDAGGKFREISLDVCSGEILGVYGLVGAGRSEWAQALFGMRRLSAGKFSLNGKDCRFDTPVDAVQAGLAYLPEDRLRQAIFPTLSIRQNLTIAAMRKIIRSFLVTRRGERQVGEPLAGRLGVRMRSLEQPIRQLSGGNQQKVVFGRWRLPNPQVLLLDEPTRGVDVAAKDELHTLIRQSAAEGLAVVLISSDLPEVLSNSHRIAVFRNGSLATIVDRSEATPETVAAAALPVGSGTAEERPRAVRVIGWQVVGRLGLVAALGALALLLSFTTNGRFATAENIVGLAENSAVFGFMSLGASAVIIAGGIDISVGSLMALAAGVAGLTMSALGTSAWSTALGITAALVIGALGGLLNAGAALAGRVHPVVVTLGAMTIYRGLLLNLTGGNVITDLPASFRSLTIGRLWGVQGAAWLLLGTTVAMWLWLTRFRAGRHLFAYGSNPRAAQFAGIGQGATWLTAFGVSGLCAGLAGLVELGQNGSMQSVMGTGYELKAIAAAVIGGTAVTGGRGSAWGAVLGAVLLAMVQNGLVLWGVSPFRYEIVTGALLGGAILFERLTRRRER